MKLPKRAVLAACKRLAGLQARPPLYNDHMMPSRIRARVARIEGWLGICGCAVISEEMRRRLGLNGFIRRHWTDSEKARHAGGKRETWCGT